MDVDGWEDMSAGWQEQSSIAGAQLGSFSPLYEVGRTGTITASVIAPRACPTLQQ